MKKMMMSALCLLASVYGVHAQESTDSINNDTTVVIEQPSRVTITKGKQSLSVKVEGSADNPAYLYSQTMEAGGDALVVTEEKNSDWDFKIPFTKRRNTHYRYQLTSGGLGFGMVKAVDAPEGMNVDMGASYELMWDHILNFSYFLHPKMTSVSVGVGITWRNYRMTGHTRFVKSDDQIVLDAYPEGADIQFSRLKVFSFTVPFMLNQRLTKDLRISIGPVINFNTHASLKTRYKLNGEKVKEKSNNIHQNRTTVDLMAHLKFKGIGLYAKYSPSNVLHTEYGPEFSSFSTGITLFH